MGNVLLKSSSTVTETSGTIPLNFAPANPTGTTSITYRMMGLGSVIAFTPLKTGRVRFTISGKNLCTASPMEIYIKMAYGTGAAPINGAVATGTVIGVVYANGIVGTAAGCTSTFFKTAIASLNPNTAYWFDLQICRGSVSGTVSVQQIETTCEELPY